VQQQMQYEFEKKQELAHADQEKKDIIVAEEANRQKLIIYTVSACTGLLFILGVVILRSLVLNRKKNKIITQQKELVEYQKDLVETKQKEILDSIHYAKRIQQALITGERYIQKEIARLRN
jgi:hypothetical protein